MTTTVNKPNTFWKQTFGLRHIEYASVAMKHDEGGYTAPAIFTRPDPVIQRPVNSTSRDRKDWKRHPHGGVMKDKFNKR